MSHFLQDFSQFLWDRKGWLLGSLACLYLYKKLKYLSQSKHTEQLSGKQLPVDSTLFPQFFQSTEHSLWLYHRAWEVVSPRAIVFIIHGYGEHIGRYDHLAQAFNSAGISVYGLDHVGHGQSQGDRAYVETLNHYVVDALTYVKITETNFKQKYNKTVPTFLLGHSMGGLVAVQMMRQSFEKGTPFHDELWPWNGCILSAPALAPDPSTASPTLRFLAKLLSNVLPKLGLQPLGVDTVSRVPQVRLLYEADRLNYNGDMLARWGMEMLRNMEDVRSNLHTINWPFLLFMGTADRIVHREGVDNFAQFTLSDDKTIKFFSGGYHELHNDAEFPQVAQMEIEWMLNRC